MAKRYFEDNNGQKYGIEEENLEARMAEAKTRGLTLKEIADPTRKEPQAQPTREEYSYFKNEQTGDKYRFRNADIDARMAEAKERGIELRPWDGKENLGVFGTMKAEAEAKAGRKMGFWGTVTTRMPFIASIVASYDAKRRKSEADFTFGNFKDAQEMLDRSRFLSPEMREKAEAAIRAAGGEISGGRVIGTPDFERVKATMSEAMKPKMVETIKTQKDAEARLERNELSTWQKIGKGTIEGGKMVSEFATPTGMMASAFLGAFNRFEELTEDKYDLDAAGNPILVNKGDIAGAKAAAEAGLGAAAEYLIWNRIPGLGKLFGKAIEGLEKIPGVAALTSGAARFTAKSVGNLIGKLQGNQGGRILMKTGEVLGQLWDKTKVGSLPTMMIKSRMTEFVDDVMGLRRQEKESEDFAKWWEKITSKEENIELILGIIGVHMGMAGFAGAKGAWATHNYRQEKIVKLGDKAMGREELVKEFAGEELAKKLSNEDLGRIFDLAVKCEEKPEKVEAFLNQLKEDQAEGQRLIDEGRNVEEVMNGLRQKMANGPKLEEAAEALKKKLEEGESVGVGGSVAERAAEFLDRYFDGNVAVKETNITDLKPAEERVGGGAEEKVEGAVDSPIVVFEAADGTRELITGAKRVAAAQEQGETKMDARIVREKEGWTREEAREINTLENLREGHLDEQATLDAVDRLGIKDPLELELLGVDGEIAEKAVKTLQEASDATRRAMIRERRGKAVEATRMLSELTRETMGDKRDAAQRVMLERVVGKMDPTTAREIARVLRERADVIDFADPRAVDEAIAEGRRRAKEEVEVDSMLVEMKDGSVKTIGEIKAEHQRILDEIEKKDKEDETPLWDKAQSSGENRGVRLEAGEGGIRSCSRFPEIKVQVQKEGVVVEGIDVEKLTHPENIEDAAALVSELVALSDKAGKKIIINDARAREMMIQIADTIKMEGEKAYSVERRNLRMGVIKTLAEATGKKCHTSARDWEWVMRQSGIKAWSNGARGTYGCYYKGEVYLNPTTFRVGAPIHEYGHATIEIVRGINKALIDRGLELVGKGEWSKAKLEELKGDEIYGQESEEALREEVLTHLIEMKGEELIKEKGIGAELKAWIKEFWAAIKGYTGLESLSEEEISKMSIDDIASRLAEEMFSGRKIGESGGSEGAKFGRQNRKLEYQFEWIPFMHKNEKGKYVAFEERKDFGRPVSWLRENGEKVVGSLSPYGTVIPDARYSRPWDRGENGEVYTFVDYAYIHGGKVETKKGYTKVEAKWENEYNAGQRGDYHAIRPMLEDVLSKEVCEQIAAKFEGAVFVPLQQHWNKPGEHNMIPVQMCAYLAKMTGLKCDPYFLQQTSNWGGLSKRRPVKGNPIVKDTVERLLTPIDFAARYGMEGQKIILVDDHYSMGQTFSQARLVAEENGAEVVGCVALTHGKYGKILGLNPSTETKLYETFGVGIDEALRKKNISGGVRGLTEAMARALLQAERQTRTRLLAGSDQESRTPSRYDSDGAWSTDRELGKEPVRYGRRVGVNEKADEHFGEKADELARKYAKGDDKAGDELYRRYDARSAIEKKLRGWGLKPNEADVEDIESSAWQTTLNAIRNKGASDKFAFSTIFFRAVDFASLGWWRKNKKAFQRTTSLDETIDEESEGKTKIDTVAAPRSFENDVMEVFGTLPESIREIIELAAKGKRRDQIAAEVGSSVDEVAELLENVREYLKNGTSASGAGAGARLFAQGATRVDGKASTQRVPGFAQGTSEEYYSEFVGKEEFLKKLNSIAGEDKRARYLEDAAKVLGAAEKGKKGVEIAKIFGFSNTKVQKILAGAKKAGWSSGQRNINAEILALNREGLTPDEIAKKLEIARSKVYSSLDWMKRTGVKTFKNTRLRRFLGRLVGNTDFIDSSVFAANDGLKIVAASDVEGTEAGRKAGEERREALRPWTKEGSPADLAKPIAMDLADLTGFIKQILGKGPKVVDSKDVDGYSTRDRVEIASRIFGVLEEGDKARLKAESEKAGFWKHEDPEWEADHDLAEVRRMRRLSEQDLKKRTTALFEKRVKTGEGGERRAAMVMAKELGHVLLWQRADGAHSKGVAMGLKVVDELVRALDGKKGEGLRKEMERVIAWYHGVEECPTELKNAREMGAELFGMLLASPEALAEKSPKAYQFARDLLAKNKDVGAAYKTFVSMKWSGETDSKLEKSLDEMWERENRDRIDKLEREANKPSYTLIDRLNYIFHDQFGPMFSIAKGSLKTLKSRMDRKVEAGLLTREAANERVKNEEEKIKTLKSGLQDFQRQSDGQERLMIGEFADVMRRAKEAGVDWRAVRRYAHLMRVIEIGGRATAYGVDPARAAKLLERLKAAVGEEQYAQIEATWGQFRGVYEKFVLEDRRVMEMFDPGTRAMLWKNTHYVTMRHTLSPEEAKAYEEELKAYREGIKKDPSTKDPTLDVYRAMNHGLGQMETEAGFEMKRLHGSFEAVEDPIAATIKRAIEMKRAAAKNEVIRDLRDVLVGTEAKDVIDKYKGTVRHNDKIGALSYMEGGKVYKLVLPAIIERSFKAKNEWEYWKGFGASMRFLKNTMTVWNPAFRNRAFLIDKAALETNLKGMHKDFVGVIAGMIPFGRIPIYAVDNYVTRHTNFTKTWLGKILYNEHTFNYYVKDAAEISRWIYRNELGVKAEEAAKLREEGRTGEASEIEEKLRIARAVMDNNVLQSQYKFDKIQRAQSPEQILEAYGLNRASIEGLKGIEKAKEGAKRGWETWNRWGEEQEAVTKLIAWMYDEKTNPGGSERARARLVIEQGGTPDLGVRGVFAAHLENATGFFWSVRKNAAIRTVKAFKDHPTEWATKAAAQTLLPAVAKGLASVGLLNLLVQKYLFDDDEKAMYNSKLGPVMKYWDWYGKAMQWVPGYQQRNYNVIPLWTPGDGGCFAMRIKYAPEEIAIVNAVHAVFNTFGPRPTDASADLKSVVKSMTDEFLPGLHFSNPALTMLEIFLAPFTGYNPHDDFRNRDIYSREAMLAGWTAPGYVLEEMGRNLWNYSPLGNFFMGIPDPKETGAAPIPKGLGALLNGVPLLSRLPASVLGFYADPSKGGLIQGAKEESAKAVALAKLRAGDVLSRCFADGNLLRIDRHVYDVAGEVEGFDRIQIYKFVQMGWRKFMIQRAYGPIGGLYKEANRIQAPTSRLKAIELINQACREDD